MIAELKVDLPYIKNQMYTLNKHSKSHFRVYNNVKKIFTLQYKIAILKTKIKSQQKIYIHYDIFNNNNRKFDLDNASSLLAKIFNDALVVCKIISDDTYSHIVGLLTTFGGVDNEAKRPYAIIKIWARI